MSFSISTLLVSISMLAIPFASLKTAFLKNDAESITGMCNSKVLIEVLGKEQVYSQSQATLVLKEFFKTNPSKSFDFIFKGEETAEGVFAIGKYTSETGEFRVTIHMKKVGSNYKIESLSIEKD